VCFAVIVLLIMPVQSSPMSFRSAFTSLPSSQLTCSVFTCESRLVVQEPVGNGETMERSYCTFTPLKVLPLAAATATMILCLCSIFFNGPFDYPPVGLIIASTVISFIAALAALLVLEHNTRLLYQCAALLLFIDCAFLWGAFGYMLNQSTRTNGSNDMTLAAALISTVASLLAFYTSFMARTTTTGVVAHDDYRTQALLADENGGSHAFRSDTHIPEGIPGGVNTHQTIGLKA